MKNKKENGGNTLKNILFILFFAAIGALGGYFIAAYLREITFLDIVYALAITIISFPLHVILHESGHLLGGLLSGYQFIMFRLFNTVWIKTEEGLSRREEYTPGILGQALMVPPKTEEGEETPFFLYHASGVLINVVTGALFILLGQRVSVEWLAYFFIVSSMSAFFLAITNAVPLRGTDGYNIVQHFKREEASSEVSHLLYMYRDMVEGASLESLQKYVDLDTHASLENPNAATMHSLRASYLLERKDFEGARKIYQALYENRDELFAGHRPGVVLNYLFTLLLTEPFHPDVPKLVDSKVYKQLKQVKQSDYIRYRAAVELYFNRDLEKTEGLLTEGEKYIPLAPTVTDENFEKTMYQYLKTDLEEFKTIR